MTGEEEPVMPLGSGTLLNAAKVVTETVFIGIISSDPLI
jgi:hypothetical protein